MVAITWRVDELAARKGWGARRLTDATGLDPKTVRNILTGRATRVDLETIARLADALDVRPGALWRTDPGPVDAWRETAGAAGVASPDELDDVVSGEWPDRLDPALERASRPA